ncbi:MAG: pyroglutamyl-peptidase I [Oscillospiraceae bacterium]
MEKRLLVTGFDPFNGEKINPSWEAVKALPERIGGWTLTKLELPTVYGLAGERALERAAEIRPEAILCVGQAGGRAAVTPEVVAINLREAAIADNAGQLVQNQPVIPGGPAAYFATLPVRDMVAAVRARGLPAALSYSAGAFVCNDLLYTLLHRCAGSGVGFVHVPFLPAQAGEGVPSLSLEKTVEALTAAIEVL